MSQLANRWLPGHRGTADTALPGEDANRLLEFGMGRLLSFVCLAEELHFGRAAQKLHISQPALSQQIAHLERALKAPLFWRGRRSVALTPAGRTLLRASRRALSTMMHAVGTANVGSAGASTQLLSYTPGSPPGFVNMLCDRLPGQLLGTPVSPSRHRFAEQVALIADGTAFAGVTHLTRALLNCTEVSTSVIGADPFVLLIGDHELASAGAISSRHLAGLALVRSIGLAYPCWLCSPGLGSSACGPGCPVREVGDLAETLAMSPAAAVVPSSVAVALDRPALHRVPLSDVPAAAIAITWASWASRAETTRLVQLARSVWQDMGLATAESGSAW
jgi:DNA-binding transcriptional LysR family regulator